MGYWIQKWYRVTVAKDRVEPIVALFVPRSNSPIEWTEYYPKGVHFRNETPKDAQDVFWREIDRMGPTKQDENDRFHLLKLLERGGRVCVPRTRAVLSIGGDGWLKIEVATIAGANADSPSDRGDSVAPVRPVVLSPTGTAQNLNGVASKEVRGWISEGNTFVEVAIDVPQAESVSLTQWELKDGQKAVAKCIGIVPPENFSGGVSGNTSEFLENGPLPVASLKPAKAVQERRGSQNINVQGFFYPIDVKNSLVIGTELVLRSQKLETPFVTAPDTTYLLLSDGWHWAAKRDKPDALSGVKVPVQTELHLLFVAKSPVPPELSLFSADKRVASVQVSARKSVSDEPTGLALLPAFKAELRGNNPVRIRNPNDFSVLAGLRSDGKGKNLEVPAGGTATAQVPDGKYEIFFVYSNKPDALFQGDDFTLKANGVEIQIVKVVGGNYGIRQVK